MPSHPKERKRTDRRLTEQRNAASRNLDRMTAMGVVRVMNREDRKVALAVGRQVAGIRRGGGAIGGGIRKGGRLVYAGAGWIGRRGVRDAVGCGPAVRARP